MTDKYSGNEILNELTLGKTTEYHNQYDAALLQPVPRSLNRDQLSIPSAMPFFGTDLWTGYEVSWLLPSGKPVVAIAEFVVPATSPNLIESKSFKLYLNSFNQTQFASWQAVVDIMTADLSNCAGQPVAVKLFRVDDKTRFQVQAMPGINIDDIDVEIQQYDYDKSLLKTATGAALVNETLNSHLLKSNCLITNQPDWASVVIQYQGPQIDQAALLKYLVSFRNHNEFHEQCVERIYCDIIEQCAPQSLSVYARYTRRGGLDINPFRSSIQTPIEHNLRTHRQ